MFIHSKFKTEPISHAALLLLGFTYHPCDYYCPPKPAHGGTYRIKHRATTFKNNKPVKGTEVWKAYLTDLNGSTIRILETLEQLNNFHQGMVDAKLFS